MAAFRIVALFPDEVHGDGKLLAIQLTGSVSVSEIPYAGKDVLRKV